MPEREEEDYTPRGRGERSFLTPTVLTLVISLLIQAGSAVWFFSSMNNRLSVLEDRQKIIDATRVTHEDLTSRDAQMTIERQELDIRLNRMDDKLDRILSSHH